MGCCAYRVPGIACHNFCRLNFMSKPVTFPEVGWQSSESCWFGCRPYHLGYMQLMLKSPLRRVAIDGGEYNVRNYY